MSIVKALAAKEIGKPLEPFEFDPGPLMADQVNIEVESCGICHSDLSMLHNDWEMTELPFVPGHEIIGRVTAIGDAVKTLEVGQRVGLGWYSRSCLVCDQCMSGNHNRCPDGEATIIGRPGGFATHVRGQAEWCMPIPDGIDPAKAGPLFCGGITVFNPIVQNNVSPMDRVAVVGIGGLGHMALAFLNKWGCDVTAFSTSPDKEEEAKSLGAHHFANSRDDSQLESLAGSFDFILSTVNVPLAWDAYVNMLRPGGKFVTVGVAPLIKTAVFPLIAGERSIGGSPLGSPHTTKRMLEFCARHQIAPMTEEFPMSAANEALDKLENGSPRYRIVLKQDLI